MEMLGEKKYPKGREIKKILSKLRRKKRPNSNFLILLRISEFNPLIFLSNNFLNNSK